MRICHWPAIWLWLVYNVKVVLNTTYFSRSFGTPEKLASLASVLPCRLVQKVWHRPRFVYVGMDRRSPSFGLVRSISQRVSKLVARWTCQASMSIPMVDTFHMIHFDMVRPAGSVGWLANVSQFANCWLAKDEFLFSAWRVRSYISLAQRTPRAQLEQALRVRAEKMNRPEAEVRHWMFFSRDRGGRYCRTCGRYFENKAGTVQRQVTVT